MFDANESRPLKKRLSGGDASVSNRSRQSDANHAQDGRALIVVGATNRIHFSSMCRIEPKDVEEKISNLNCPSPHWRFHDLLGTDPMHKDRRRCAARRRDRRIERGMQPLSVASAIQTWMPSNVARFNASKEFDRHRDGTSRLCNHYMTTLASASREVRSSKWHC